MSTLKIVSTAQIRALDAHTLEDESLASIDLMERASRIVFNWLSNKYPSETTFTVFCGSGNNGGDGLVIARLLHKHGYKTDCYVVHSKTFSEDNLKNQSRLAAIKPFGTIKAKEDFPAINTSVVIDALFGSGINRPVTGLASELIEHINSSTKEIVSIDIASGLYADCTSEGKTIVRPAITLTFQLPKLAFLLPENELFTGAWHVLDIGLSAERIEKIQTPYYYTTAINRKHEKISKFSHKGSFGHAMLIAGSYGKMGAALLASRACMKSGAGLLTVHVPKCGYQIMQIGLPEAMVSVDSSEEVFSIRPTTLEKYNALAIGPGLGTGEQSFQAFREVLTDWQKPLVIDADGLNMLSQQKALLDKLPKNCVLTPHPGEFQRLVGPWSSDFEKLELLQDFCKKYRIITVLKGAHTAVCNSDGVIYFNSTGNPGMATAGSGDVLTGIILSYLAQGYTPLDAARTGVYDHGIAGDLAYKKSERGRFLAGDIIEYI